jgi:transcription antitermination protein NusB
VTEGRRAARRTAFVVLYQWDVTGQEPASLYEGEVEHYARELVDGVVAGVEALDRRITAASIGWPAERLGAPERTILRLGLHELDAAEVPAEVVIDEAVTLAKRYGSEDAGRLVNGILGRIVRERVA